MKQGIRRERMDGTVYYQNYDVDAMMRDREIANERRLRTMDRDNAESLTDIGDSEELQEILRKISKLDVTKKADHVLRERLAYEAGSIANEQGVPLNQVMKSILDLNGEIKIYTIPSDQMEFGAFGMKDWSAEKGEWSYFTHGGDFGCNCDDCQCGDKL